MPAQKTSDSSQTCPNCGATVSPKSKFCKKCGARLHSLEICPKCGSKLDPDAVFCEECGFRTKGPTKIQPKAPAVKRLPLGLEILIVFGALGAAFYFFSAMMVIQGAISLPFPQEIRSQLTTAGIAWIGVAGYQAIVSVGLWKLKEWARKALILNALLALIVAFFALVPGLFSLIYSLIILWYVYQPHVKLLFQVGRVSGIETHIPIASMVPRICPSCGKKGKPSAKFCVKCGAELKEMGD